MRVVHLFTRDLRVADNEALSAASQHELGFAFCLPENFDSLSPIRAHSLTASLRALKKKLPVGLGVFGSIDSFVARLNDQQIAAVYATRNYDTLGMLWQSNLAEALYNAGIALHLVGSNYAVVPGEIRKDDGSPLKVYTPFYRRWSERPAPKPVPVDLSSAKTFDLVGGRIPPLESEPPFPIKAGEDYALRTLRRFIEQRVHGYHNNRDRTDLGGTSHLFHALAHGEIHPRTILSMLPGGEGAEVFRKEIAWREFYADVLWHNPESLTDYYEPRFAKMRYDKGKNAEQKLSAWKQGLTGYPMVDAGMRQLLAEGWMHNRVRMIVASFLVKDLHLEWQQGASHFEEHLTDFDPASNSHGWQWTAGCGTDASPYYRVFNPILQGYKFDPNGDYVRKYIPELRHIPGPEVHEPWGLLNVNGYPEPIVDHAVERDESLARLAELKEII